MSWCVSLWVYGILHLLNLIDNFLFYVGEIFNYNPSKVFSYPFFFSSSVTPIIQMLVHLIFSHRSLRLSSALFTLFALFCSSDVISTILPSSLLIHSSASDILLLISSGVFLISVIMLFVSVCFLILLGLC